MSFKDQSWHSRFEKMGDEAEGIFEEVYPLGWARFGLNRPPIQMFKLSDMLRYTPDYITSDGLVEVMGFGQAQALRIKIEKLVAMDEWAQRDRVRLFVWDKTNERHGLVDLPDLAFACRMHGKLDTFPEGKQFYEIPAEKLPVREWVQYIPAAAAA